MFVSFVCVCIGNAWALEVGNHNASEGIGKVGGGVVEGELEVTGVGCGGWVGGE